MLDTIIQHDLLGPLLRQCCEENMASVIIDESLCAHGVLNSERIVILKIDAFYNTKDFAMPPKSIDCLIIVKCKDGSYSFYLVELKDVGTTSAIKPRDVVPKFETVLYDFFQTKFSEVFMNPDFILNKIKMWLVTDALRTRNLSDEQYRAKVKGTVLEQYNLIKPFRFRGHVTTLEVIVPTIEHPVAVVGQC